MFPRRRGASPAPVGRAASASPGRALPLAGNELLAIPERVLSGKGGTWSSAFCLPDKTMSHSDHHHPSASDADETTGPLFLTGCIGVVLFLTVAANGGEPVEPHSVEPPVAAELVVAPAASEEEEDVVPEVAEEPRPQAEAEPVSEAAAPVLPTPAPPPAPRVEPPAPQAPPAPPAGAPVPKPKPAIPTAQASPYTLTPPKKEAVPAAPSSDARPSSDTPPSTEPSPSRLEVEAEP